MAISDNTSEKDQAIVSKDNLAQKLKLELAEKLMRTFDLVISGRSKYFSENPDKIPTPALLCLLSLLRMQLQTWPFRVV